METPNQQPVEKPKRWTDEEFSKMCRQAREHVESNQRDRPVPTTDDPNNLAISRMA